MSASRIALWFFLVLALIGVLSLGGFMIWRRTLPTYDIWMAQWDMSAEKKKEPDERDYQDAKWHLYNAKENHPDDEQALLLLADVMLDEAEAEGRPRTYAANPGAMQALEDAAKLRPDDEQLQLRLLTAYLETRYLSKAAIIAADVYQRDPTNSEAHYALTWDAVRRDDKEQAEKLFASFNDLVTRRIFQTLALKAQFYQTRKEEEKLDQTLADATTKVEEWNAAQLSLLTPSDRQWMMKLLLAYQQRASDPAVALDRAEVVIRTIGKLKQEELLDQRYLADMAAHSIGLFDKKFASKRLEPLSRELRVRRRQLSADVEAIGSGALNSVAGSDQIVPLAVYWNNGRTLLSRGKYDEALKVINDGIKASEKMNDDAKEGAKDLHLMAARIHSLRNETALADMHLEKLAGDPELEARGYLLRGEIARKQGRLKTAHEHFLKAQQVLGPVALVQMALARSHMARQQWAEAIELLDALQKSQPEMSEDDQTWFDQMGGVNQVHLDLLRCKLALGQWRQSQQHLLVLKDDEKLAPVAWALTITYLWEDAQDKAKARDYMDRVLSKYPRNLGLVLLDARLLNEDGKTNLATERLEDFAADAPDDMLRQLALVRWHNRNGSAERALEILAALRKKSGVTKSAASLMNVFEVQALVKSQQYEAAKDMTKTLRQDPLTAKEGYRMRAELAFRENDNKVGVAMLEAARKLDPRDPALNMLLSEIRKAQGDYEGVIDAAGNVAGIDKYESKVQRTLTEALRKIEQTEGVEVALGKADELLQRHPNDLALTAVKADFLLRLKRGKEAVQLLSAAQKAAPQDANFPRLRAQAWMSLGQYDKALSDAQRALELDETNVDLMLLASQAAIGAGKFREGAQYADGARRAQPDSPQGYLLMGEAFRRMGELKNAIVVLEAYRRRKPNDYAIYQTLADVYRQNGQTARAVELLERARANQPKDIRYVLGQLEIYLKSNPKRKSEAQILARDLVGPSRNVAHMMLVAQMFAKYNENLDAQSWAESALGAANVADQAAIHSFLGRIFLRRAGQEKKDVLYEKALGHFEKVRVTHPQDLIAGNNVAWLLANKFHRVGEAVRVVEEARGSAPVDKLDPNFIDTMVDVYVKANQRDKAVKLLREAVKAHPGEDVLRARAKTIGLPLEGEEEASLPLKSY